MTSSSYEVTYNIVVTSFKGIPKKQIKTDLDATLWVLKSIKKFFTDPTKNNSYSLSSEDALLVSQINLKELPNGLEICEKIASFVQKYVVIVPTNTMLSGAKNTSNDINQNFYFFETGRLKNFSSEDIKILKQFKKDHWLKLQRSEVAIISELGLKFITSMGDTFLAHNSATQINIINTNKIKAIDNNTSVYQPLLRQTKKTAYCSCILL